MGLALAGKEPTMYQQEDIITITDYHGYQHTGRVLSAVNYGTPAKSDWYIEIMCRKHGGYEYWKESLDRVQQIRKEISP